MSPLLEAEDPVKYEEEGLNFEVFCLIYFIHVQSVISMNILLVMAKTNVRMLVILKSSPQNMKSIIFLSKNWILIGIFTAGYVQ